jgi:hypothetical protein
LVGRIDNGCADSPKLQARMLGHQRFGRLLDIGGGLEFVGSLGVLDLETY